MRFLTTATALLLTATTVVVADTDDECGLYMAVSSTSDAEAPKWGLYAGKDIPARSPVGHPELAIQTHNLLGHAHVAERDDSRIPVQAVGLFEEYIWVADATAGKRELDKGRIVSAVPGAGVLGGFNAKLTNADWDHTGAYFRESIGEAPAGVTHPGRGASTHFYNVTLRSKEDILAGAEIFLDYGENWEDDNEDDDSELKKKDYTKADKLIDQMIDFFAKYEGELTDAAKTEIYEFLIKDIVNAAAGPKKGKKIYLLLPKSADELIKVKEAGGALMYSQPSARRDLDWLKENGKCMDQLEIGPSTIPHAGRGAFAKRSISKGGLVGPVPLVHIPDKSTMDMYEVTRSVDSSGEKYYHRVNDEVIGQQMLLNYCYGHPESSMLLFPAGSMTSFINHSAKKPNAKMVFSNHPHVQEDWLEIAPVDLVKDENAYIGLMVEIVALRNIKEGEEVLMDYGPEWQKAWDAHVLSWNANVVSGNIPKTWPIRALDMNQEHKSKKFATTDEGTDYPENLRQMCFLVVKDVKETPGLKKWATPKRGSTYDDDNLFDCSVLERIELEESPPGGGLAFNYTIEWYDDDQESTKVINVPHQAIVFVDKAYTSDHFAKHAFRHAIGIPDDVFPKGPWRDLATPK